MSNIIKNISDIEIVKEELKELERNDISVQLLSNIIENHLPKEENRIRYLISYDKNEEAVGEFNPRYEVVILYLNNLVEWLDNCTAYYSIKYDIRNIAKLRSYIVMHLIMHEIEHSYQYLKGEEIIEDSFYIQKYYHYLCHLLMNERVDGIIRNYFKQKKREKLVKKYLSNNEMYYLERNANIESFSGLLSVCYDNKDYEMIEFFNRAVYNTMLIGYKEDNKGSIFHTFDDLEKLDIYNSYLPNLNDIDYNEKIKNGLEITDEERLILKKRSR